MARLIVEGGRPLTGGVRVGGNKNSALPLLVACLLTDEPCELRNVPAIRDVDVLCTLMEGLGVTIERPSPGVLRVHASRLQTDRPDASLVGRLRGSVLLLGA